MMVRVRLSALMRIAAGDTEVLEVPAGTPLECADALVVRFPGLRHLLHDEEGDVRPQVWFFLNGDKLLPGELERDLNDGDELFLILALSGG